MTDILLINPSLELIRYRELNYTFPQVCGGHGHIPQFFLFLGGYLRKKGFSVDVLDMEIYSTGKEESVLLEKIDRVDYVGLTAMSAQVPHAMKLSKLIRKISPEKKIIWGGVHPTLLPDQTVSHQAVDYVIVGEGEEPLVRLLSGSVHPRIVTKAKPYSSPEADFLPPDEIADPDFSLINIDEYYKFQGVHKNIDILSSRGCPYGCTFCINTITRNKWRSFNADRTIAIIRNLYENHRLQHSLFLDEDFFLLEERARKIIDYLAGIGMTWDANITVKKVLSLDDDYLRLIRDSGVHFLKMGAESGSDRLLKIIKKNITADEIYRACCRCLEFGITPSLSFMCDMPDELPEETKMTFALAKRCKSAGANVIGPQTFRPYPGSLEFNKLVARGLELPDSLEKWASSDLFSTAKRVTAFDRLVSRYKPALKNSWYRFRDKMSAGGTNYLDQN